MYTILCKNKNEIAGIILMLAENGLPYTIVENDSVQEWSVIPPKDPRKLTNKTQVESFIKENRRMVLHDRDWETIFSQH